MQPDAVLDDHQRQLVALGEHVERVAQADRIDLPTPVRGLDIGIRDFLARPGRRRVIFAHEAHVVGEREIIDLARLKQRHIAVLYLQLEALSLPLAQEIRGIVAAALDIGESERPVHLLERRDLVERPARGRVDRRHRKHAADLEIRIDLVTEHDGLGRGDELMVRDLREHRLAVLALLVAHARVGERRERIVQIALVVDLVERHPVLDLVLVTLEADPGEAHEEIDELAAAPAAVLRHQMIRHLEMRERDDRLHAVLMHLVKEVVVELETGLIRRLLIAVRENARPGDRGAETFETELREQRDILLVVVIEVDRLVVRIVLPGQDAIRDLAGHAGAADRHDVSDRWSLAARLPRALELMRGDRTAPKKSFRKAHTVSSLPSRR